MKEQDLRDSLSDQLKTLARNQERKGSRVFDISLLFEIARRIRDRETLVSE